ncbi:MAG: hypothetical protein ACLUGU_10325 [Alistipes shahii]
MKRWVFILIAALAIFLTADLCARERGVKFSGGTDLVSTYVWRGVRESGPAFQPSLTMSAGNFSATAWGSVDFDSAYKEMDLTLAYALGPVTLSVADLYWTGHADDRYFVFDSRSPHRIEVGASWVVSEKGPRHAVVVHGSLRRGRREPQGRTRLCLVFRGGLPVHGEDRRHEGRRGHGFPGTPPRPTSPETAGSACRTSSSMPENHGPSKGRIRCRSAFSPT